MTGVGWNSEELCWSHRTRNPRQGTTHPSTKRLELIAPPLPPSPPSLTPLPALPGRLGSVGPSTRGGARVARSRPEIQQKCS